MRKASIRLPAAINDRNVRLDVTRQQPGQELAAAIRLVRPKAVRTEAPSDDAVDHPTRGEGLFPEARWRGVDQIVVERIPRDVVLANLNPWDRQLAEKTDITIKHNDSLGRADARSASH